MPTQQSTTTTTISTSKSMVVAYVLWFFFGQLGAHRFYLGKTGSAVAQLILGVLGWLLATFVVGFFLLGALWIWLIVDIFLIPGLVRSAQPVTVHQVSHTVVSDIPGAAAPVVSEDSTVAATEMLPPKEE